MISFQEENRIDQSFWLLGDSFLRAFYSIYDGQNLRIGLVGSSTLAAGAGVDEQKDEEINLLIYVLPGAICLLCILAICLSVCITYRLRKRQLALQNGIDGGGLGGPGGPVSRRPGLFGQVNGALDIGFNQSNNS